VDVGGSYHQYSRVFVLKKAMFSDLRVNLCRIFESYTKEQLGNSTISALLYSFSKISISR